MPGKPLVLLKPKQSKELDIKSHLNTSLAQHLTPGPRGYKTFFMLK